MLWEWDFSVLEMYERIQLARLSQIEKQIPCVIWQCANINDSFSFKRFTRSKPHVNCAVGEQYQPSEGWNWFTGWKDRIIPSLWSMGWYVAWLTYGYYSIHRIRSRRYSSFRRIRVESEWTQNGVDDGNRLPVIKTAAGIDFTFQRGM
jgi:hypothetical protein